MHGQAVSIMVTLLFSLGNVLSVNSGQASKVQVFLISIHCYFLC